MVAISPQASPRRGPRPAQAVEIQPRREGSRSTNETGLGFGAVAGLSALAAIWLDLRVDLTGSPNLRFLAWNLILGWVPYLATLVAVGLERRGWGRWWNLGPIAAVALLFLPNAPYLVTDLVHLHLRREAPFLADAGMLITFAAAGWMLGLYSLRGWKRIVEARWGPLAGWGSVVMVVVLTGFGIYLGRVQRWNSWDLLRAPDRLLADAAQQLLRPRAVEIAAGFALLLLATFVVLERR